MSQRIGVELILPIAAALPLGRHLRWGQTRENRGKVADHLIGGIESLVGALGGVGALAMTLGGRKHKAVAAIGLLLTHFGDGLTSLVGVGRGKVKQGNIVAAARQETLRTTFDGFEKDLLSGEEGQVLLRSDK